MPYKMSFCKIDYADRKTYQGIGNAKESRVEVPYRVHGSQENVPKIQSQLPQGRLQKQIVH